MGERAIIVFSRLPERGRVKRRLARELGEGRAYDLFRRLFVRCLEEVAPLELRRFLCVAPGHGHVTSKTHLMRRWPILHEFEIFFQNGVDLGERMKNAFGRVFSMGIEQAVLVGTDIPGLNRCHIMSAFERISRGHLAIGPCEDGGYYLIGFKKDLTSWGAFFEDVPWGGSDVLDITLMKARQLHVEPTLLELLYDIDLKEDFARWTGQLRK